MSNDRIKEIFERNVHSNESLSRMSPSERRNHLRFITRQTEIYHKLNAGQITKAVADNELELTELCYKAKGDEILELTVTDAIALAAKEGPHTGGGLYYLRVARLLSLRADYAERLVKPQM